MKNPLLALAVLLIAACGAAEEQAPAEPVAKPQGRPETQSIRNTKAVGYDGNAVADAVDEAIEEKIKREEENAKRLQQAAEQQESGEMPPEPESSEYPPE
jgi:outer membrane biogenesis lipoprotein LolB